MSIAIFLSNMDVKAVIGTWNGKTMTVTGACKAQAPEGSIINGQVINEEAFSEFLEAFWEEHNLPKKDVTLVLGSSQAVTRVLSVPKMSHKKRMEYLPRELARSEQKKDSVYAYIPWKQEGRTEQLIGIMAERSCLPGHIHRFRSMGVTLSSVVTSTAAELLTMGSLSYMAGKTCIVQILDGMSLINLLYVDGEYFHISVGRVFGQRGTPAFGIECARSISGLQQFLKTQQVEQAVTNVYLGGSFGEEDVEVCRESILQMDGSLEVDKIGEEQDGIIRFQAAPERFEDYITSMGGLMVPKGQSNLLYQQGRDPERLRQRRELANYLAPMVVTAGILSVLSIVQAFTWFRQTDAVNLQLDYLGSQKVIEEAAEYDRLTMEITNLDSRISIVGRTREKLDSYPVYTSRVKQVIAECAAGVAAADITKVDLTSGVVTVEASSGNAEGANQFVERLERRADMFESVFYDGFQYDERLASWKTTIKCYLVPPAAKGEVTP